MANWWDTYDWDKGWNTVGDTAWHQNEFNMMGKHTWDSYGGNVPTWATDPNYDWGDNPWQEMEDTAANFSFDQHRYDPMIEWMYKTRDTRATDWTEEDYINYANEFFTKAGIDSNAFWEWAHTENVDHRTVFEDPDNLQNWVNTYRRYNPTVDAYIKDNEAQPDWYADIAADLNFNSWLAGQGISINDLDYDGALKYWNAYEVYETERLNERYQYYLDWINGLWAEDLPDLDLSDIEAGIADLMLLLEDPEAAWGGDRPDIDLSAINTRIDELTAMLADPTATWGGELPEMDPRRAEIQAELDRLRGMLEDPESAWGSAADQQEAQQFGFDNYEDYQAWKAQQRDMGMQDFMMPEGYKETLKKEFRENQRYQMTQQRKQAESIFGASGGSIARMSQAMDEANKMFTDARVQNDAQIATQEYNMAISQLQQQKEYFSKLVDQGMMSQQQFIQAQSQGAAAAVESYAQEAVNIMNKYGIDMDAYNTRIDQGIAGAQTAIGGLQGQSRDMLTQYGIDVDAYGRRIDQGIEGAQTMLEGYQGMADDRTTGFLAEWTALNYQTQAILDIAALEMGVDNHIMDQLTDQYDNLFKKFLDLQTWELTDLQIEQIEDLIERGDTQMVLDFITGIIQGIGEIIPG